VHESLVDLAPALSRAAAATEFLAALSSQQRKESQFKFDEPHRTSWEFEPLGAGHPRYGVPWPDLTALQRAAIRRLLGLFLSDDGLSKVETIMEVEPIQHPDQGRRSYAAWFYGIPSADSPWSLRFEGHHLSLTFTMWGAAISTTPLFLGVSPTLVQENGDNPSIAVGTRALWEEEDASNTLWNSLDDDQRTACAIVLPPLFERTPQVAVVPRSAPAGLRTDLLRPDQQRLITRILAIGSDTLVADIGTERCNWNAADPGEVWLAAARGRVDCEPWGHARPGGYYYRLQGARFLYEYDDVQWGWQESGHIHTVWRSFDDDFGVGLLEGSAG
jgi:hypothetical protein